MPHFPRRWANYFLPDRWGWALAVLAAVLYAGTVFLNVLSRRRVGVRVQHPVLIGLKLLVVVALCFLVVYVCNRGGGVPLPGVLIVALLIFWTYISKRTTFGRHVYAVGGNAEAARRAGINVKRIRIIVFMISSSRAAARWHRLRRPPDLCRPERRRQHDPPRRDLGRGHRR
jgi:D-xylose transport system permease protein